MTTLAQFANGDTNYVTKLNGNFNTLAALLDAVNNLLAGQVASAQGPGSAFTALFGSSVAVIGASSYATTGAGSNLTVGSGFAWIPSLSTVVSNVSADVLSFTGQAAATYYVQVDATGTPTRSDSSSGALYSVVWDGSAFGTITRLASIVWGAADDVAAQVSAALGASYTTLDARLEAGEVKAVEGALAYDYNTGLLTKSVAGGATVTLTSAESNNSVLTFTGVLTASINVEVPLPNAPRVWLVINNTTGAFALNLIGQGGAGEPVAQGSVAWAYHDGTDVVVIEIATLGALGSSASLDFDTDVTLAANSDILLPTQKAVKAYVDSIATSGATDVMVFKGVIDCSANPNYPAADAGNLYKISVAGKIGGASGVDVEAGDTIYCLTDSTASGTQAAVGTAWNIAQANLGSQPFDIHTFYPGIPTASAKLYRGKVARAVVVPANFTDAEFTATANATASTVFDVQKNGVSCGTCTIAAGTMTPTFATTGGAIVNFAKGDIFAVLAPATPDATLTDPAITFAFSR